MSKDYSMGVIPEIKDNRLIKTAMFQTPAKVLPKEYFTDISMLIVQDQGPLGTCTWNSLTYALSLLHFWDTGIRPTLSYRHGYAQTKYLDGIPELEGSFYSVVMKVAKDTSCCEASFIPNDTTLPHKDFIKVPKDPKIFKNAQQYRIRGYAGISFNNPEDLKQAIVKNGFIIASITVGKDLNTLPLKPMPFNGYHGIFVFGYRDLIDGSTDFYFLNSWGEKWGVKGIGKINSKDYFTPLFSYIREAYTITDIPQNLIEEAQRIAYRPSYRFTRNLKQGDRGPDVKALQDVLKYEGCIDPLELPVSTEYFGDVTRRGLLQLQLRYQLGDMRQLVSWNGQYFGPSTREIVSKWYSPEVSLLDRWAMAVKRREGYYAPGEHRLYPHGTRAWRNKNPGNIKYIGQPTAIGSDKDGFCIFQTYEDGLAELKALLRRCATKPDTSTYKHDMSILQWAEKYAPYSDGNQSYSYAYQVAKDIGNGVDIYTPIYKLV